MIKRVRYQRVEITTAVALILLHLAVCVNADRMIRRLLCRVAVSVSLLGGIPGDCLAGMLTFPLPSPLKNNYALIRAGESTADAQNIVETNPVKKLSLRNSLSSKGKDQARLAAVRLAGEMGFSPTFIWVSNTQRAYETATVIGEELQLGQNRIIPEYSFLDARSLGILEGTDLEEALEAVHIADETQGVKYKAPPTIDGTPSDSISDVLVRMNQLISSVESFYSGENVLVVAPDSDILSVLLAALSTDDPDSELPKHAKYAFDNGQVKLLEPVIKPPQNLVTGQTVEEGERFNRKVRALKVASGRGNKMRLFNKENDVTIFYFL